MAITTRLLLITFFKRKEKKRKRVMTTAVTSCMKGTRNKAIEIDSAQMMMITTNGNIDIVPNKIILIDVESSIGEWLYYMKNLIPFDIFTNITSTKCNIHKNSTRKVVTIDMECILKDRQLEINKRSEVNSISNCGECDENIDEEDNDEYDVIIKCSGRMTISANY